MDPFPTPAQLDAFYASYVGTPGYMAKAGKKIRRSKKRIRRLLKMTPGRTFLDVGCNCGFAVVAAAELGLKAHGIDIDAAAIEICKARFGDKGTFAAVSVEQYAASGAKADIVYTSEVIEHVPDPNKFTAALAEVLAPGGILYLTTPDSGHFSLSSDFTSWRAVNPPEHIVYFTRDGMHRLLARHGFCDIRFRFSFKPGMSVTARRA
ncbi:MAG: class I SAM-dependent methyltransferase [Alphaproteobacteria bacterium]